MDKEQLGTLIITSEDTLYRMAKTLLREDEDCADAISSAVVKAFAKLETLRSDAHAKTWLIRILLNECYTLLRQKSRTVSLEDYPPAEEAAEETDYSDLYEALERLPERSRLCVSLYYMEGYSIREIAELLDSTESMVKSRLSRARVRLREELSRQDAGGHENSDRQSAGEIPGRRRTGGMKTEQYKFCPANMRTEPENGMHF